MSYKTLKYCQSHYQQANRPTKLYLHATAIFCGYAKSVLKFKPASKVMSWQPYLSGQGSVFLQSSDCHQDLLFASMQATELQHDYVTNFYHTYKIWYIIVGCRNWSNHLCWESEWGSVCLWDARTHGSDEKSTYRCIGNQTSAGKSKDRAENAGWRLSRFQTDHRQEGQPFTNLAI